MSNTPKVIVTPLGPALTSSSMPRPGSGVVTGGPGTATQTPTNTPSRAATTPTPPVAAPLVARPLGGPEFTNVKWLNPGLDGRWILREDPGKAGSTLRYSQAIAQGYRVATKSEAEVPGLAFNDGVGAYINGDLILMCMPRERYQGAVLYKDMQARIKSDPRNLVNYTRNQVPVRSGPGHQVVVYEPGGEESRQPGQQVTPIDPRSPNITVSSQEEPVVQP